VGDDVGCWLHREGRYRGVSVGDDVGCWLHREGRHRGAEELVSQQVQVVLLAKEGLVGGCHVQVQSCHGEVYSVQLLLPSTQARFTVSGKTSEGWEHESNIYPRRRKTVPADTL
jgi:hypothetical protein